jgi:hypothetical protein
MATSLGSRHGEPETETEQPTDLTSAHQIDTALSAANPTARRIVTWLCLVAGIGLVAVTYFPVIRAALNQDPWLLEIFRKHYAAIFGLPGAALLSFILVVVFEARFDRIEMEIANVLKFRGASGPVILWVLCFLSMTLAIKLLW